MNKIFFIAYKDIRETFKDRNLLLVMFAAPLALATIIAFAFSGLGSGSAPVQDIPVAVVNLDQGSNNFGQIYVDILVPQTGETENEAAAPACARNNTTDTGTNTLHDLTNAVKLDDAALARAGVDDGTYAAAIIIPENFSESISYSPSHPTITPVQVEVYANGSRPVSASVIRSVTEGITNQIATGNIAIAATVEALLSNFVRAMRNGEIPALIQAMTSDNSPFAVLNSSGFGEAISCAFSSNSAPINVERQTVEGEEVSFNPLVIVGASQAIFFALFTANGAASSVMEERRNWTLQRMLISPTPRPAILLGKLLGVFCTILLQLAFLFIGFTLVGSLIEGQIHFIWGTNIPGILIILITTSLAAAGLGSIVAAASKTPEQSNTIGSVLAIAMAALGGSFGFSIGANVPALSWTSSLSIVHWGTDAFTKLALNDNTIWTNAIVMGIFGAVTFIVGLVIFNRRLEEK